MGAYVATKMLGLLVNKQPQEHMRADRQVLELLTTKKKGGFKPTEVHLH